MNYNQICKPLMVVVFGLLIAALVASPALAGTKYMSGSPNLTASIAGSNEFTPGTTVQMKVLIQNTGLNTIKMVQSGIVDRDDVPSTAKMVKVTLGAGDAPVLIKSDPQMIGDIKASNNSQVPIDIRVRDDAKAGTYLVPLNIEYTYLADADQQGTDSLTYRYVKKDLQIELPFVVKSAINLDVLSVTPENINAGGSGYVTLKLKNSGTDAGMKSIAKLSRSGSSPVVPVDSTVYIGTFAPGQEVDAKFKVSVSKDGEPQEYPLSVLVSYENADGETLDTPSEDFGVPVGSKVSFTVTSPAGETSPGKKQAIEVTYRNDGAATAYSAEARISAVDPFTSNDDLAYLGDLKPGESGTAKFEISTASDATKKTYGLDSEIRYRDALDNSQISDTVKVPISVVTREGITSLLGNPVVLAVLLVIILGGGYYLYTRRQKKQDN
ncbi:MAG: S-layer protein [Methanospirillum sp.]|uniref:COG1361 S-layer family protein n=1 Tax=Methanospirillum sp. TaxID=45200 RepID=UPI002369C2FC|nr:S-layer protein [Methanospirillum sp.]MDD1729653.1 S-layer protein [Methanospirillum sp.]